MHWVMILFWLHFCSMQIIPKHVHIPTDILAEGNWKTLLQKETVSVKTLSAYWKIKKIHLQFITLSNFCQHYSWMIFQWIFSIPKLACSCFFASCFSLILYKTAPEWSLKGTHCTCFHILNLDINRAALHES